MRDEVLLTCCPPAPDERDAFTSISDRGIDSWSFTSMASGIAQESTRRSYVLSSSIARLHRFTTMSVARAASTGGEMR